MAEPGQVKERTRSFQQSAGGSARLPEVHGPASDLWFFGAGIKIRKISLRHHKVNR